MQLILQNFRKNLDGLLSRDFEDGLEKTVDWYLTNAKWLERVISGDYEKYYDKQYVRKIIISYFILLHSFNQLITKG